jgi:uncharacterized protein (TIGR02646 family)
MRNVPKLTPPQVLVDNKPAWDDAVQVNPTDTNKNRYRHADIKARLLEETSDKCVYCESKIGHNCPGDIEHKAPKGKRLDLIFDWDNLTIACNECNRRKLEYYDEACQFLDPNVDDVESLVIHMGPIVFHVPGEVRSELSIRILELDKYDGRKALIARKMELLENIRNLRERIEREQNELLRQILAEDLLARSDRSAEFSGMEKTYVEVNRTGFVGGSKS